MKSIKVCVISFLIGEKTVQRKVIQAGEQRVALREAEERQPDGEQRAELLEVGERQPVVETAPPRVLNDNLIKRERTYL